jgi:iron-sulfur cluster repair protein YtfE (RIC family)
MIIIHLNFKMADDKDKKKKKTTKKKDEPGEEEEEESNKINYFPRLDKVEEFFKGALKMIVASTNKVSNLEDDLMPFLQKEKQPNFPITEDFPWVVDAMEKITTMFKENIVGPNELLEKYK